MCTLCSVGTAFNVAVICLYKFILRFPVYHILFSQEVSESLNSYLAWNQFKWGTSRIYWQCIYVSLARTSHRNIFVNWIWCHIGHVSCNKLSLNIVSAPWLDFEIWHSWQNYIMHSLQVVFIGFLPSCLANKRNVTCDHMVLCILRFETKVWRKKMLPCFHVVPYFPCMFHNAISGWPPSPTPKLLRVDQKPLLT